MNFFCEMADIQNYLLIEYKDEYQKSKWTIECRIFISFIWMFWSRSENAITTTFSQKNWFLPHILACLDFRNRTSLSGRSVFYACFTVYQWASERKRKRLSLPNVCTLLPADYNLKGESVCELIFRRGKTLYFQKLYLASS